MADYNTRGQKHGQFGKDYDFRYNKAVAWNPIFDKLVAERLKYNTGFKNFSDNSHALSYDKEGNRTFDKSEITIRNLELGEVVEIETELSYPDGDEVEMIRKAIIRLPKRKDGEQIVVVADFDYSGETKIKTAYLNKASDNHQSGLDTTNIDRHIGGMFGVKVRGSLNSIYNIENGVATKVEKQRNNNKKRRY